MKKITDEEKQRIQTAYNRGYAKGMFQGYRDGYRHGLMDAFDEMENAAKVRWDRARKRNQNGWRNS